MKWHAKMTERRVVWLMAAALAALTVVPMAIGYGYGLKTHRAWTGLDLFSMGDMQVYLSYVDQVKNGHWLIINNFTNGHTYPFFSVVWLAIGLVARVFCLSPLVAISLAKVAGAVLVTLVAHWSLRHFLSQRAERLWALGLLLFGGGLGWTMDVTQRTVQYVPIDWWVPEAFVTRSALTTPHFLVAWALLLVVFTLLYRSYRDGNRRDALWSGAAALLLVSFHPYHAPTIAFVGGMTLVVMSVADLRLFWRRTAALAIVMAMTAPAMVYHWWLLRPERNGLSAFSGNICWTPALLYVLIGFGAFVPLAIYGASLWLRRKEAADRPAMLFLVTWAVSQFAVIYAPTMLQRRFIQGLLVPLAALAGVAMASFFASFDGQPAQQRRWRKSLLAAFTVMVFGMTLMWSLRNDLAMMADRRPSAQYFTTSETAMFAWMRANLPSRSVVVSDQAVGGFLPERADAISYLGHWSQTVDVDRKTVDYSRLVQPEVDAAWARGLFEREGVGYVYLGWREEGYGQGLDKLPFLEVVHREGVEKLYRVRLDK